jgi:hypothetical protein
MNLESLELEHEHLKLWEFHQLLQGKHAPILLLLLHFVYLSIGGQGSFTNSEGALAPPFLLFFLGFLMLLGIAGPTITNRGGELRSPPSPTKGELSLPFFSFFFLFFPMLLSTIGPANANKGGILASLFVFFYMLMGTTRPPITSKRGASIPPLFFSMLLGVVGPTTTNRRGSFNSPFFDFFVLVGVIQQRSFVPYHCH